MFFSLLPLIFLTTILSQGGELTVGIPEDQSPHIYLSKDGVDGVEGKTLDKALKEAGFQPIYITYPSLRVVTKFKKKDIDATINVAETSLPSGYKASFRYKFQNCAFTLANRKLKLNHPDDFKNLRVAAFKNAANSLKDEAVDFYAKTYKEVQSVQSRIQMLNTGRVDVIISEKEVFYHYLKLYALGDSKDYEAHCFFEPSYYWLMFNQKKNLDQFEKSASNSDKK